MESKLFLLTTAKNKFLIVDLEATCSNDHGITKEQSEIIEIGAILIDSQGMEIKEYQTFVRPLLHPLLTSFCIELTTIQQKEVDAAEPFVVVFPDFLQAMYDEQTIFCSWGF